ncbi:hypothetical protein NE236_09655 [Actinoallomurus purpureus]|uniref:hypothetical protein n=1 Tax=Actinoallomurus purpureus TaxID=478114 RepID=UPI002093D9A6|nr:hypothetical protein [Actinoallomurus purpureus]MCO6005250.1 hypothetical protein [Actinoallomurus purpureus]
MNISEAKSLNRLLGWMLGIPAGARSVTAEEAHRAAELLADRAHKTLHAGATGGEVRAHWPTSPPAIVVFEDEMVTLAGTGINSETATAVATIRAALDLVTARGRNAGVIATDTDEAGARATVSVSPGSRSQAVTGLGPV